MRQFLLCFVVATLLAPPVLHAQSDSQPAPPGKISSPQALTQPASEPFDTQLLSAFGLRPALQSHGLTLAIIDTLDFSKNLSGGVDTEPNILRNLLDIRLTLDTQALANIPDGAFSIDFQNQAGQNGSHSTGDLQTFDNTDAGGFTQISELWYQQYFLNKHLRIKFGKVDANTEFAQPSWTNLFLNASWGYSPTITGLPTFPNNSTSFNLFVYPADGFYAGVGVYDGGGPRMISTGPYGPSKLFHSDESLFTIAEAGVKWQLANGTLPGRFALGASYDTARITTFNTAHSGAASFYTVAEQKLYHTHPDDKSNPAGLYASLQYGHADANTNRFTDHLALALIWTAPYEKENPDTLSLGFSTIHLSRDPGSTATRNYETSLESFYNYQLTKYCAIRPDLQYILHPAATTNSDHALVFTLRVVFNF